MKMKICRMKTDKVGQTQNIINAKAFLVYAKEENVWRRLGRKYTQKHTHNDEKLKGIKN